MSTKPTFFRNRAESLAAALDLSDSEWHIQMIDVAMREVAKQQRHACAEAVAIVLPGGPSATAHRAAMNATPTL